MPDGIPSLDAYGRAVVSPYGLLGNDENALSFALGHAIQQCPRLLQWFLRAVEAPTVRLSALRGVRIALQHRASNSRDMAITDIEIRLPGRFHVIVEAKIGLSVPSGDQCQQYLDRLRDEGEPFQRLLTLVQAPDATIPNGFSKANGRRLASLHWSELIPPCVRLLTNRRKSLQGRDALQWFYTFLDREYPMKAFTTEVWILPAATKPLWRGGPSYLDIHQKYRIYFDHRTHAVRPLYIGFRANGKLDALHRVLRTEHETPVSQYVPGLKTRWRNDPLTIWHLDAPVVLPRPLPTGGSLWQRRTACDFDLLLRCGSVAEVEKAMKERRSV